MTDPASTETAAFAGSVDPEPSPLTGQSAGGYTAYATVAGHDQRNRNSFDTRRACRRDHHPRAGERGTSPTTSSPRSSMPDSRHRRNCRRHHTHRAECHPPLGAECKLTASPRRPDRRPSIRASPTSASSLRSSQRWPAPPPDLIVQTVDDFGAESCAPDVMPSERAHDLTNTFTVAFLDSVFRDGEMIDRETTEIPDDVVFMTK